MRWLQWSTLDLKKGLGGVEVHARSLARELENCGYEAGFSTDPADLEDPRWDVIHTHGSAPAPKRGERTRAVRVHTLHGTTLGRMAACGEWTWPGGYAAAARELHGVRTADVVLSVHPKLSLYVLAGKLGKTRDVCWNGWDPSDLPGVANTLSPELSNQLDHLGEFWLFVGRGDDRMKGADLLQSAMRLVPDLRWVAAPGSGFEGIASVLRTGRLSSPQVRELMSRASGLALPSRYEGHSLVLLEALASGLPVVATQVGGVPVLPDQIEGLVTTDSNDPRAIADSLRAASLKFPRDPKQRDQRALKNREILPSWKKVAQVYLSAVDKFKNRERS